MNDQTTLALYVCRTCGAELPYQGVGRPRVFCDDCRPSGFPHLKGRPATPQELNGGHSGLARTSDPATSKAAAAYVDGEAVEARILEAFELFGWLTADECVNVLLDTDPTIHPGTIATAISRLSKSRPPSLVDTGTKRPSNRGRAATVWGLA